MSLVALIDFLHDHFGKIFTLIIVSIAGFLIANDLNHKTSPEEQNQKFQDEIVNSLVVIEYEGHEYIILTGSHAGNNGICHKENCKYCNFPK